jgi:hypothetical protein
MIYQVGFSANTCRCKVVVNGLGVAEVNAEKVGSVQYPCNTELIGKENKVEVEVMPASLTPDVLDKIAVEGYVKKYHPDDVTGPENGEVVCTFTLEEKVMALRENPLAANLADVTPFALSCEFDSEESPSFRNRLVEAELIEDEMALLDWAMAFRGMLERRDAAALYELYEPKLIDYDIAYPEDKEPDNREWFANWMFEKIFPQTPRIDFDRDGITPVKWCGGRIWELRRKDGYNGGHLWQTEGLEGRRTRVEVYVGMVDGKIKIIR